MHLQGYLRSAESILQHYKGDMPFAAWLKNYFRQHKKYGSRDRKMIADLSFCFFRLGSTFSQQSVEERLLIGQFLCHGQNAFVQQLKPEWQPLMEAAPREKMAFLGEASVPFPYTDELSAAIEKEPFAYSHLQQPDLFLRLRPGKEKSVINKLSAAGISFHQEGACLRLANNSKADETIRLDEEAVVQDISSQQVVYPLLQQLRSGPKHPTQAWDCCAASGGKSILLHDLLPGVQLTVSDIRESILVNLRNRLKRAGIQAYHSFVADVASPDFLLSQQFDLVLCDAPCSGSGTWGRTPEQLVFFNNEKIDYYASLQKNIAHNASRSLAGDGFFLYITCSVFFRENEGVVQYLQQHSGLKLLSQHYFKGYEKKGDTLFAALFTT